MTKKSRPDDSSASRLNGKEEQLIFMAGKKPKRKKKPGGKGTTGERTEKASPT